MSTRRRLGPRDWTSREEEGTVSDDIDTPVSRLSSRKAGRTRRDRSRSLSEGWTRRREARAKSERMANCEGRSPAVGLGKRIYPITHAMRNLHNQGKVHVAGGFCDPLHVAFPLLSYSLLSDLSVGSADVNELWLEGSATNEESVDVCGLGCSAGSGRELPTSLHHHSPSSLQFLPLTLPP